MGIAERKEREREERKALIREKAKMLLLENGVQGVSVQSIADAAELSKAAIYLYFDTKERILLDILNESTDRFVRLVRKSIEPGSSGLAALRTLWNCFRSFYGKSNEIFLLAAIKSFLDPYESVEKPSIPERPEQRPAITMRRLIADVFAIGVKDGALDPFWNIDNCARVILLLITSCIHNVSNAPVEERDIDWLVEEIRFACELFFCGLSNACSSDSPFRNFD